MPRGLQGLTDMDVVPRLKHAELLIAGLFHCTGALLDRLVENGLLERLEIDATLEAVEDRSMVDFHAMPGIDEEARLWLATPARILRLINEYGEASRTITTRELCEILDLDHEDK